MLTGHRQELNYLIQLPINGLNLLNLTMGDITTPAALSLTDTFIFSVAFQMNQRNILIPLKDLR